MTLSNDAPFKPLDGIRVIEISHMIMGPSCGQYLAFLGAEVIKVEPPNGDKTRMLTGMGAGFFPMFNRGKKSVCLDLETPAGRADLARLLETADVLVENFKDQSLERMGLGPQALRNRFPRLIVAANKGFLRGPYESRTAMDEVVQMMSGLAYMTGPSGRPLRVGSSANDMMAGLFGAMAVIAALMEREKTEKGREIRIGLFENCLFLVGQHMVQFDIEGVVSPPMPERKFSWPVYDIFETADGAQMFVAAVTGGHWVTLCDVLGLEEMRDDPELATPAARIRARPWSVERFASAISTWESAELAAELEKRDIPFSPINRPADMYEDPHVMRPGGLMPTTYDGDKTYRAPGLPIEVDGQSMNTPTELPEIGADTDAILNGLQSRAANDR